MAQENYDNIVTLNTEHGDNDDLLQILVRNTRMLIDVTQREINTLNKNEGVNDLAEFSLLQREKEPLVKAYAKNCRTFNDRMADFREQGTEITLLNRIESLQVVLGTLTRRSSALAAKRFEYLTTAAPKPANTVHPSALTLLQAQEERSH